MAAVTQPLLGKNAKLFAGPAGTTASTEVKNCRTVTVNMTHEEADATTRGTGGFSVVVPTLKSVEISFSMLDIPGDPSLETIRSAYVSGGPVALKALSAESGWGPDGDFIITAFNRNEDNKGLIEYSVTAKPTLSSRQVTFGGESTPES